MDENYLKIHVQRLMLADYDQLNMNSIHSHRVFEKCLCLCNNVNKRRKNTHKPKRNESHTQSGAKKSVAKFECTPKVHFHRLAHVLTIKIQFYIFRHICWARIFTCAFTLIDAQKCHHKLNEVRIEFHRFSFAVGVLTCNRLFQMR